MVNLVILLGRLGKDPEVRHTDKGTAVAGFNLATSNKYKNKSGDLVEDTEWHRCVAFSRNAEIAGEYLKKGSLIYLEGRLQTRNWTDSDNVKRFTTEVVVNNFRMLSGKPDGSTIPQESADPEYRDIPDDDVPF